MLRKGLWSYTEKLPLLGYHKSNAMLASLLALLDHMVLAAMGDYPQSLRDSELNPKDLRPTE